MVRSATKRLSLGIRAEIVIDAQIMIGAPMTKRSNPYLVHICGWLLVR
jgi:hypothetical protein